MNVKMSTAVKTWKVLSWLDRPAKTRAYMLCCPHCETDQQLEIGDTPGGVIIAALGLGLVFDPPSYSPPTNCMPDTIQCRYCKKIFESGDI